MLHEKNILAIDPGVKNTGVALVKVNLQNAQMKLIDSFVIPLEKDRVPALVARKPDLVVIEKFVVYRGKGVDVEEVARRIGWVEYAFYLMDIPVKLIKAVEWQTALLKHFHLLPKAGKKFNLKAKKFVKDKFGLNLATEHEADAFLIAYTEFLRMLQIDGKNRKIRLA
jgi:Holliday junction resolvasome RuvABC endonuclease subunit